MIERAAQRMAERVVADAPEGWTRAVVAATIAPDRYSSAAYYVLPGDPPRTRIPSLTLSCIDEVAQAAGEDRGWETTNLEFECRPSGEYTVVAFSEAITALQESQRGFRIVMAPDYRPPQPGTAEEEGIAAPTGTPDSAQARFRAYLDERAAILGHSEQLPPPASSIALDEAERRLGRPLPGDLRALYAIADGDSHGDGSRPLHLFDYAWMSLEEVVRAHEMLYEFDRFNWGLGWDWPIYDTDPPDTVRRCSRHPAWLPFADGEDGNYLAVDMSPARNGRAGQIIAVGRDYGRGPVYVTDSVTSLLGHYLQLLERGDYEKEDDHITIPEPSHVLGPKEATVDTLADIPPTIQEITVTGAQEPVDLSPLAAVPRLHRLKLHRCATGDLAPLRALPVESACLSLEDADLGPLEGHRHLSVLKLATSGPIDIGPLRTLPHLRHLDLTQARVENLEVLADMPGLRWLALTARQWTALLDAGAVPPRLAAAHIAGTADEARAWAQRLGLDTSDAVRVTGSLGAEDR
ncbi:SMI1/KNR4 family protein [Streptomonospora algeriensis]|uniref:SMI1/KNR4 family protein n=1 Tax=Streptomonospora algeriensis TaxID=995084 RepID=A0ABW3B9K9_9ACTN